MAPSGESSKKAPKTPKHLIRLQQLKMLTNRHRSITAPRSPSALVLAGRRYLHLLASVQNNSAHLAPYTRLSDFRKLFRLELQAEADVFVCIYGRHGSHKGRSEKCGALPDMTFRRMRAWLEGRGSDASFLNAVSEDGRVLNAISNWAGDDGWHWSEVVTYSVAVEGIRRRLEERRINMHKGMITSTGENEVAMDDMRAIGKVRRIVRTNICNPEWRMAKEEVVRRWVETCEKDSTVLPRVKNVWDDVWIEVMSETEEFEMMVGTPNGVGTVYLLAHNKDAFPAGIRIQRVRINPLKPAMEFILEAPGEDSSLSFN